MRFVVLGAGAIGGSLAARLALNGHVVVVIARGAHGQAIREHGLYVHAPDGSRKVALPVAGAASEVDWRDHDVVLLAVKTQDVAQALSELATVAPTSTPIVCLTNGVEAERIATRFFAEVHGVCVFAPASFTAPGAVQQWSAPVRGVLDVGRYPDGATALDAALALAFSAAEYRSAVRGDIMRWKRGKLIWNLGNALEALCGPAARESSLHDQVLAEARACLTAAGLSTTSEAEGRERYSLVITGCIAGVARPGGSTWQSLARGTRSVETDYLNGEIVLLGRLHGVATPVNALLQRATAEAARAGVAPGSMPIGELLGRLSGAREGAVEP